MLLEIVRLNAVRAVERKRERPLFPLISIAIASISLYITYL